MNSRPSLRSLLPLIGLFAMMFSTPSRASTDFFSTGPGQGGPDTMCDVWQAIFNGWGLAPGGDEDQDGCSNWVESVAGTNPRKAGDCHKVGNTTISATTVIFDFEAEAGKKYRVLSKSSPGGAFTTAEVLQTITVNTVPQPAGGTEFVPDLPAGPDPSVTVHAQVSVTKAGTIMFYKLEVSDVDTDHDGVSDWAEVSTGLDPTVADSDGNGIDDGDEIAAEVSAPDVVTIASSSPLAYEDGPQNGMFIVSRTRSLIPANVTFSLSGTATNPDDFAASPAASVSFASGQKTQQIHINPTPDSEVEGSESVTAKLMVTSAGNYTAPVIDPNKDEATVIIYNSAAPIGTGLTARYYDYASSNYDHAANFGDFGNYTFTRGTPTTTGTILVTPNRGVPANQLAAITVGEQVKLSFNGGNLNTAQFNHQLYTVTAKTASTFTCSISSSTALPSSSSSNLYFSLGDKHPGWIERIDATVDNEWAGGTPNGNSISPDNDPDNWSSVWEGFLHPTSSGNYRFQLDADDKARVLVDLDNNGTFDLPGEQILEHGWDTAATGSPEDGVADDETIGTFKISNSYALAVPANAAARLRIRVEQVETTGEARCRLQWSRNNATFANIPQANVFSHVAVMNANYNYTRTVTTAGAMAGTILVTLNGHGYTVAENVDLAFSSGNLFTPANGNFHGTFTVTAVNSSNTFTVAINAPTLPASGTGAGYVLNRPTTTNPVNAWFNRVWQNTGFSGAPGRVGTNNNGTNDSNNGLYGTGTPDVALIDPDAFTARWTGQIQPQFSEEYTISVLADDGATLKINGEVQDLKVLPTANSGGSTYFYENATGRTIVYYGNSILQRGNVVAGETLRLDAANGTLNLGNNSLYVYDSSTGDLDVDYSNLTNVNPGAFIVGEIVEVDPTSGPVNLGRLPYTITDATATTFTVNIGAGVFSSGSGNINVTEIGNRVVTAVYPAGAGSYSYTSAAGDTVIDYAALGYPPNTFATGQNILLDPTSGNLSSQAFRFKTITAHSPTTFTVNYGTSFTTGTGTISMVGTEATVPPEMTAAFAVDFGAGKHADLSVGTMNFEFLNKKLKHWASNGNERYVRLPLVGGTRYDIDLQYWESSGFSRCKLYWFSPSQPKQIIPTDRLYPVSVPHAPPAHLSDTSATALVGGAFSYAVLGSNGGTVGVTGNPPWLTYSGGVLSGTPTGADAGDYQIIITITNADGTSTSVLNLHVEDTGATISREFWNGVSGTSVADIPVDTPPTGASDLTSLEAPTDFGDNYAARIRGYITAPETGNYYFWIAGSNAAELWISNDDEPVNAFKRAWVNSGTTSQEWNKPGELNQRSPWIALEQGHKYYIEILHKAGVGAGDNLAVGWAKPGESGLAPSEVVPGYAISPYVAPPPGSTPGTLYVATLLSQDGVVTSAVGTATLRISEDETVGYVTVNYNGLTGTQDGPLAGQPVAADGSSAPDGIIDPTDWHVHSDPYLGKQSFIIYDGAEPLAGDGPQLDAGGNFVNHKWNIIPQGTLTVQEIRELIKQGKAYINLHTAANPNGEIRGNFTLANGSRTFTPPPPPPAFADDHTTDTGAVRFLQQATFGPNIADIAVLKAMPSYEAWIDDQFTKSTTLQLPEVLRTEFANAQGGAFSTTLTFNAWWRNSISGEDQLRQRLAFALSEIHVVSGQGPLLNNARALSYFYDKLAANAFGNFRQILEDTTLTPSMGRYLDMLRNDKPDQALGRIPNENYAREIKQLFSVGLYRMWPDGTLMLTSKDAPIDTYSQREIVGFSHVFTGWDYGYDGAYHTALNATADWTRQMREVPARHFTGPKRLLNNEILPGLPTLGNQPLDPLAVHNSASYEQAPYQALPAQELAAAHDQLFNHPNVGPFICRQLIQRLVTSHPSRDYLYRVVSKFNDNGAGVRGDMKAVIKAILLDYEARSPDLIDKPGFGKQREPLLRVAAAGRALRPDTFTGTYTQNGNRTITIDTTTPHGVTGNVFLEFSGGSPDPWTGIYGSSNSNATRFTVQAQGWQNGTYSIPANSTTCTVTMTNHWIQVGNQFYVDFTSGGANGSSIDTQVYTVATNPNPTSNGNNGNTFTFTVPADPAARSGNLMIPRFTPGSYTTASSGLAAPNDRRVTMDTNFDHHLNVGDQVQLNFYGGNPEPIDMVVTVESIVDLNTYTFLAPSAGTNLGTNQGNNSVYQFPLLSQPLVRSGTINSRSSTYNMGSTDADIDQSPLNAATVFNYFLPDFKNPGALASQGLTTPEFQTTAETTVIRQANFLYAGVHGSTTGSGGNTSFKTGNNSLVLNLAPWMPADATNIGLGAPTNATVPWTHNQNIDKLIDHLSTLFTADQLSLEAKTIVRNFVSLPIASIPVSNPCAVNTTVPHGYVTGDVVCISGVNTNGNFRIISSGATGDHFSSTTTTYTITVVDEDTFTVNNVECLTSPGAVTTDHVSPIVYNQGTTNPSTTNIRDRLRAIIHMILASPDFTIQR